MAVMSCLGTSMNQKGQGSMRGGRATTLSYLKDSHSSTALEIGRRVENPFLINVNGNGLNEIKYCATCKIYRPPN